MRCKSVAIGLAACAAIWISHPLHADQESTPIKHVIVIMQENRSFDSYFGTFPGANGLNLSVCLPLDRGSPKSGCVMPFHDPHDSNAGGPHGNRDAEKDLDKGITQALNDGFAIAQAEAKPRKKCEKDPNNPECAGSGAGVLRHDVMGYHDAAEIPNYWAYAQNFVLQDAMFAGVRSWSLPAHLDLISEWVAACTRAHDARSCTTTSAISFAGTKDLIFPWVNLFQLFDVHNVSWKYYLAAGQEPDCEDGEMDCPPETQDRKVPSIWNPGPAFTYIKAQAEAYKSSHFVDYAKFATDIAGGTLPQVSWIVPNQDFSEHPPAAVSTGMEYVTSIVNTVMQSPYWANTVIFITWDDWGGFYDHAVPPIADMNQTETPVQGFGLRVPGLMISAYAKAGTIDHDVYSDDSYATFIEDLFAGGARLDPAQLGNPDSRPDIRDALKTVTTVSGENVKIGNLMNEFDFSQKPLPPLILSTLIPTRIAAACDVNKHFVCRSPTVTISWIAVTGASQLGITYHVQRDGTELAQCVGQATQCTDEPGPGAHLYRAYTVDSTGTISPLSPAAEADEPTNMLVVGTE
jgi:phospholipase C